MRAGTLFSIACLALAALSPAGTAHARGGAETVRTPALPGDAVKRLRSGDESQIKSALDDVRISAKNGAPAVPAILDLLDRGLSPPLTVAAIETLGDTEAESASPVLAGYARHRASAVRRAAVQALAHTRGPVAVKALRAALSDPEPSVRGLAATALGTVRARESVGDLLLALDHRVVEASPSIGEMCAPAECERLIAKLGVLPFEVITSGLDQALFRPPADVNDELKIKMVAHVRELGTAEANHFLRGVQTKWPKAASAKVKQAIDQAVLATSASPGGPETTP